MENRKALLQRQLQANMIKAVCAKQEGVIFREAWCTQERCIRFTTPLLRALFRPKDMGGKWESGDFAMYEVQNDIDKLTIDCLITSAGMDKDQREDCNILLQNSTIDSHGPGGSLYHTELIDINPNTLVSKFEIFLQTELPRIEAKLVELLVAAEKSEELTEGAMFTTNSSKYERNRRARQLCLNHYGTVCKMCGMDFGATYGEAYANLIEVHHIVPLHEIREEYVVDPIKDLIPLCPNCHALIHAKERNGETVKIIKSGENYK